MHCTLVAATVKLELGIEDYHTYFVGNNSVLVHNADYVINKSGNIEITDWEGYPENMPKPEADRKALQHGTCICRAHRK